MDMSSGVSSAYAGYLSSQATSKLDSHIKSKDYTQSSEDELLSACKEFEAYFLEQVFEAMQKTVDVFKDEETSPNDSLVDFFKDSTVQQLASTSTENDGLGLAQMLYEQMKRNYNL